MYPGRNTELNAAGDSFWGRTAGHSYPGTHLRRLHCLKTMFSQRASCWQSPLDDSWSMYKKWRQHEQWRKRALKGHLFSFNHYFSSNGSCMDKTDFFPTETSCRVTWTSLCPCTSKWKWLCPPPHQGEICHKGVDPSGNGSGASSSASLRVKWKLWDTRSSHSHVRDVVIISNVFTAMPHAWAVFCLSIDLLAAGIAPLPFSPKQGGQQEAGSEARCCPCCSYLLWRGARVAQEPHCYPEETIASPSLKADASQPLWVKNQTEQPK